MTTITNEDERTKVIQYLEIAQGHLVEESDKAYKFMTQSLDRFNQVKGFMFLMDLNVGDPKDSSLLPDWKFGRIYKEGADVNPDEEKKF